MAAQPETIPARRRYAPMRHPGRRGRWDADAIRAALRAWAAETGAPPRSEEWSGTQPERAGPAQRKWMREHPRWPSGSCVRGHFGSWSGALEAAGLPVRRLTFTDPVAERVATARRLAAGGATVAEVAAHLGVSTSTAGNYLRAGPCPGCGGPVVKPGAERCAGCTRARADRRPDVDAAGGPRGRPRLVRRARRAAVLPGLDPVAFAARAVGGREPALAERGRRLPPVRRPRRPVERRAGRGRPAAALRALARRAHPVRARRVLGADGPPAGAGRPERPALGGPEPADPAPPLRRDRGRVARPRPGAVRCRGRRPRPRRGGAHDRARARRGARGASARGRRAPVAPRSPGSVRRLLP